ncbi:MAG: MFS transporter [Burkholderiales bacterium]|nr:MFS transporter [Burkholderiales bacterium]
MPSLFTRPFVLLCLAMFLGYANQWVFMPIVPLYVDSLGGSAFVAGLAILTFSVPSFASRPFVGHIADSWNAAGVMAIGLALLAAGSLLMLFPFLAMVFVAGVVRGLGWAGTNTGGYTTLATAAPRARRGEATGYYTSATGSATILFPALALWIVDGPGGFPPVFLVSSVLAAAGLPIALALRAHVRAAREPAPAQPGAGSASLIDRGVLLATGLNLCSTLAMPSVIAFLPLYARELGIDNIGYFYVLAGATSLLIRPVLGRKSDAMGRGPALALGLGAQSIGFALVFAASGLGLILAGGFFVAVGFAVTGSTTTALAIDLAHPASRGRGMATFSLSFQMGAGLGATLAGALADLVGLRGMYAGSLVITAIGLVVLASAWRMLPGPARA